MLEKIKKFYKLGLWTEKMINDAVSKKVITSEEADKIINNKE